MTYSTTIYDLPLADAKARLIRDQKLELHLMLSLTDWLIIRREDTGANIPESVMTYRSALRAQQSTNEAVISSASSIEQLKLFVEGMSLIREVSAGDAIEYLVNYAVIRTIIEEM